MKLQIVSDLHLEFNDVTINNAGADILCLAGDISLAKAAQPCARSNSVTPGAKRNGALRVP